MSDFISKVQHKTYEKGEFSEEKTRTLDKTIELIKKFPWEQERPLTSVELTGPSVTIKGEEQNWLKIGLFFNGKFCLYYLDCDNHLYEYHASNLDETINVVIDFFGKQLNLQKFEKHFFNIGNQIYFVTKYFEYNVKLWWVIWLTIFMLMYAFASIIVDFLFFTRGISSMFEGIFVVFSFLFFYALFRIFYHAVVNRNNYLQISKGNDIFYFGIDKNHVKAYDKKEINQILVYDNRGGRNPNFVVVYEIYFKDETILKFSNMLISDFAFKTKFSEDLIKRGKKGIFKVL